MIFVADSVATGIFKPTGWPDWQQHPLVVNANSQGKAQLHTQSPITARSTSGSISGLLEASALIMQAASPC